MEPSVTDPSDRKHASVSDVLPTVSFGPYRLLERIGEGGMGEVWVAEQREPIRRTVAVKVIKIGMDTRQVVARFEAERQALAVMDHPAIAKVLDAGATDLGRPYFVMEFVKGEPITTYCDRQRLSIADRLALFIRVCEGVQHAHQKGIIHRDLKPSNVLVTVQDGPPVPKIIDFGIAKATGHHLAEQTIYTELGVLVGTPAYMSPEQAEMSGGDADTRTDVYSLGVLLYELLTGSLPFEAKALREKALDDLRRTIREVDPPRPSTRVAQLGSAASDAARSRQVEPGRLASQLRGDLDWVTMKALEKDRTRRYDTAIGLANDIRRHFAHEPVSAGAQSTVYRAIKFVRRHRFGVAAAGILVALLVAFGATMALQAQRIARERDRANREAESARQLSDFLVDLFKVSDPNEAQGRSITAREILSTGAVKIDDSLQDQPEIRARLQQAIGDSLRGLGLYADAERLLRKAVDTNRRLLGRHHPATLGSVLGLAEALWSSTKYGEAEVLFDELADYFRQTVGERDPSTLSAEASLGATYVMQGRLKEGETLLQRVADLRRQSGADDDLATLLALNSLQGAYYKTRRYAEALPVAQRVLNGRRRLLGTEAPLTITALHNLATIYDQLGRDSEAEPLYLEVIQKRIHVQGEMHPSTCNSREKLAMMYADQKRYAYAEPLLVQAYTGFLKAYGDKHERTVQTTQELASLYDAWGKSDKAAEWRKRSPG